jgi:OmpA-OmpF porin, OOP family
MTSAFRILPVAVAVACAAMGAQAQTGNSSATSSMPRSYSGSGAERSSVLPYTHDGYVGISGGRSKYDLNSGNVGLESDNTDNALKLYTGGFFHPNWGLEVGYVNAGKARRLGGETEAHGFNLSLVGRAPLSEQFDLFGKVGTTYGRTRTSGFSGLGVQTGKEDGFGLSYGVGARWSFNPQWAAVIEWESHKFKFSDGDEAVKMTTVGLQYRF